MFDAEEDNARLMKAEILRELGRYEEAEAFLGQAFQENFAHAVFIISDLNRKRESHVA